MRTRKHKIERIGGFRLLGHAPTHNSLAVPVGHINNNTTTIVLTYEVVMGMVIPINGGRPMTAAELGEFKK